MDQTMSRKKQQTARLSVFSNSFLILLKLAVGIVSGTVSIISEAAHSGVDLIAALVAFYAVRKSGQPPDENHDYGHGKIENLSGAIEAVLIIIAAIWIVHEAFQKFSLAQQPEYLEYGIMVMLISIAVNYWVSKKLLSVAKETGSQALEADALHLRADIWTSVGVLTGLAAMKLTGYYWLDPLVAIVVAGIVFRAGCKMTKKSFLELTDISLPDAEAEQIGEIVNTHKEVITFHRLRTRRSGSYRLIDMHVILDKNMHLDKAHAVCDSIEREIEAQLGHCDVVIHLEPCNAHCNCEGETCQIPGKALGDDKIWVKSH
ncbi:MAG: cation diffusion facilitator family transporter [Firmicutes bacterium]|nr:cation diffusion facilitator family transporter [Bacillota bacterium]